MRLASNFVFRAYLGICSFCLNRSSLFRKGNRNFAMQFSLTSRWNFGICLVTST